MARIDDANRRILTKKFELGLFERPLTDRTYTPTVGSAAHRALARQAVRESQVLLKNAGNVLPLATANNKIFVAGKSADNIGNQSGGWTISWQGSSGNITPGTTILQGIRSTRPRPTTTVTYNATRHRHRQHLPGRHRGGRARPRTPRAAGDRTGGMSLDATDLQHHHDPAQRRRAGDRGAGLRPAAGHRRRSCRTGTRCWRPGCPAPRARAWPTCSSASSHPTGKLPMTWMNSASQQPINDGDGQVPLFP